jgi:hypothetical protein
MSGARVLLFETDARALLSPADGKEVKEARVVPELNRLKTWMQKHQDDVLTASEQQKLSTLIRTYYGFACDRNSIDLMDRTIGLLDDYLKYPEGKLVSGKLKQQILKIHQAAQGSTNVKPSGAESTVGPAADEELWMVVEVDENTQQLSLVRGCEEMPTVSAASEDLFQKAKTLSDNGEEFEVLVVRAGGVVTVVDVYVPES